MIETKRMLLKRFSENDYGLIAPILCDPEVMYAWEHGFSRGEIEEWLRKNIERYGKHGIGWLRAVEKDSGKTIGAIGLIYNEDINGKAAWELAYLLDKKFWGKGYAKEGAQSCVDYAFDVLGAKEVVAQMRTNNDASRMVAESLGMKRTGQYDRKYCGKIMPHYIYVKEKDER